MQSESNGESNGESKLEEPGTSRIRHLMQRFKFGRKKTTGSIAIKRKVIDSPRAETSTGIALRTAAAGYVYTAGKRSPYNNLNKDRKEIRLLRVRAAQPGRGESPLHCTLEQAFLDESPGPNYETISYCWGDASVKQSIYLDGEEMKIPASARAALRCMRPPDGERVLWIDAVCINQADPEERGHQVQMMYDIYSGGQNNLIHLGGATEVGEQAKVMIAKLLDNAREETDNYRTWSALMHNKNHVRQYCDRGLRLELDIECLEAFYSAPWFGRLWVVQEVALAPKNVWHYGQSEGNMEDAIMAAEWLAYKTFHQPVSIKNRTGIRRAVSLYKFCADTRSQLYSTSLFNILQNLDYFNCIDDRDRIYAVVGLHQKLSGTTSLADWLNPSYEKTLVEVLRDATRYMIQESQRLSILKVSNCYDRSPHTLPGCPSWVPYWHIRKAKNHLGLYPELFSACGQQRLSTETALHNKDLTRLTLRGYLIDSVRTRSHAYSRQNSRTGKNAIRMLKYLESWFGDISQENRLSLVLAETLIAGKNARRERATKEQCADFFSWTTYIREKEKLPPKIWSLRDVSDQHAAFIKRAAEYDRAFENVIVKTRSFLTDLNSVGLGPGKMIDGDKVVILFGFSIPVILRRQGDHYSIIGPCYVHGIMDGEAVKKSEAEGRPVETFILV